jgi:hypothetical protein
VTYLFRARDREFIRGWHGVLANGAFYLPDVFLENTFESGQWITGNNIEWPQTQTNLTNRKNMNMHMHMNKRFNMRPTMASLSRKAGSSTINTGTYELYDGYVKHIEL